MVLRETKREVRACGEIMQRTCIGPSTDVRCPAKIIQTELCLPESNMKRQIADQKVKTRRSFWKKNEQSQAFDMLPKIENPRFRVFQFTKEDWKAILQFIRTFFTENWKVKRQKFHNEYADLHNGLSCWLKTSGPKTLTINWNFMRWKVKKLVDQTSSKWKRYGSRISWASDQGDVALETQSQYYSHLCNRM